MFLTSIKLFALAKGWKIFFAILIVLLVSLLITAIVAFFMLRSNAKKKNKAKKFNQYNNLQ